MPTYVALANFTNRGARDIANAPDRIREAVRHVEEHGIVVRGAYVTLGSYDEVLILEAADDETIARAMFTLCEGGNARTTTMRAFTIGEFDEILKS